MARESESGLPIEPVYGPEALAGFDPQERLGEPGAFPYTRGVYPNMYTGRPWTMRQYAGFGTAKESNERYHRLVEAGTGGLSVAFDLPTQMGYDSDDPVAHGEVGKVGRGHRLRRRHAHALRRHPARRGVDVDDHQRPGGAAAAAVPARRRGAGCGSVASSPARSRTTCSRSTSREAPTSTRRRQSLRLISDIFAYCHKEIPRWNTISISGYHMAEAGATPAQEVAFTLANAKEYVRAALGSRPGGRRLRAAAVLLLRVADDAARGGGEVPRRPADLGPGDA